MAEKRQVNQRPQNNPGQYNPAVQQYGSQGVPYTPPVRQGDSPNIRYEPQPVQPSTPRQGTPVYPEESDSSDNGMHQREFQREEPGKKEPLNANTGQSMEPVRPEGAYSENYVPDMTRKDWLITLVVAAIPIVGIIMMFVWAFGEPGEHPSRKAFAQADLIFAAIMIGIYIVLSTIIGSMIGSMMRSMMYL